MPPRKTKKKGPDPSPDLPGLFPTHDGSYGINTLVNIDPESGKGHKPHSSIAREQSDDRKWMKSMKSKVAKKYGMDTDLKKAIDQSHKEVEQEETRGQSTFEKPSTYGQTTFEKASTYGQTTFEKAPTYGQTTFEKPSTYGQTTFEKPSTYGQTTFEKVLNHPRENPTKLLHPPSLSGPSNTSTSTGSRSTGSTQLSEPPDEYDFIPKLTPHIPTYNPTNLPFPEEHDDRPRPPYTRAELPSTNPHTHVEVTQPMSPISDYIPFYGIPQGEGSTEPITPARPDSSRSFNYESGLFADATLQTPGRPTGLFGASQTTTQELGIARNQTLPQFGVSRTSGAGGSLTSQAFSSMQPSSTGQFPAGGPTSGLQPISDRQSVPDRRPIPGGRLMTSKPPNIQGTSISGSQPTRLVQPIEQPIEQPASNGQPTSGGQSTTTMQPTSARKPTLGAQSTPSNFSNYNQFRNQPGLPKSPNIPDVLETANILTPGRNKQRSTKQVTPKSTVPQSAKSIAQRNLTGKGRGSDRRRRRVWQSSDLFCRSAILFFVLAITLWFIFSTIPIKLSDYDNLSLPRASNPLSNFSIGRAWRRISDLLPEVLDIHGTAHDNSRDTPSDPGPQNDDEINIDEVLRKMRNWMPETIWTRENKSGKLEIPEDLWYALRQRIEEDDSLLSLKNSDISEDHWRAIKSRIQNTGSIEVGTTTEDMKALVEKTVPQAWDSWLKRNDQAIKSAIMGVALAKDDFMKLFQQEIASHQHEIRQELRELQERIQDMSQQMFRLHEETAPSDQVTKAEMAKLIHSIVSKAVSNVKLDAVAQGLIKGHANDVLANQVDFFGIGSGALIDFEYSSAAWKLPKNKIKFMTKEYLDTGGYKAQPRAAALSPWTQEGECFCADPDIKGYGEGTNNISVILSRNIIPQHLVVEHILPGATLDPGAMPREIEVWAYIEETSLRNEVRTFSETQFPDTPKEEVLNDGFVKIGHFTYENKTSGDGVQVFKMSDELTTMDAITAWVVVRAINNYGADHTCFYRLRLYGEVIERPDDPPAPTTDEGRSWRSWFGTSV
ncbi:hypothetical protein F5B18DRAFT_464440 [Nemania serpens]|nr:hypothetical protein F5B18DRAFT_464440 [Nemania serpens]